MENLQPYVLSSRPVILINGKVTYLESDKTANKAVTDKAMDYFNLGRYDVTKPTDSNSRADFKGEFPSFFTHDDYEEKNHFSEYSSGNYQPGTATTKIFDEVFTSLKKKDKMLYIYLHGFGNDAHKEKDKQVIPMLHSYFPYSGNQNSPIGEMIFLTWPSQGFTQYKYGERDDVSKMAGMTTVFFLKLFHYVKNKKNPLFADGWEPKIAFHSQSMGCKILLNVAQRIKALEGRNMIKTGILDRFFHRIIMTGADIDLDALNELPNENNEEIHRFTHRLILFSNPKDVALWISRFIFLSGKRLGRHLDEDMKSQLPHNLDIIELTGKKNDFIGHNYFTEEQTVITGLQKVLSEFYFDGIALENRGRRIQVDFNDRSITGGWMNDIT